MSSQKVERFDRRGFLSGRFLRAQSAGETTQVSPIETGDLLVDGPRCVGKMNLYVLLTNHDRGTWNARGVQIEKLIEQFPTVIPEYRPSEYSHLEDDQNPLISGSIRSSYENNYLFVEVERICNERHKDVWVLGSCA